MDDTRDLVIALRQDVLHLGMRLEQHMAETTVSRVTQSEKIDNLSETINQVKGGTFVVGWIGKIALGILSLLGGIFGAKIAAYFGIIK